MTMDAGSPLHRLAQPGGRLQADLHAHGGLHGLHSDDLTLNLFPASALEAGPANLWLRCLPASGDTAVAPPVPLLGPASPGRLRRQAGRAWQQGVFSPVPGEAAVHYQVELVLAASAPAWFWRVALHNTGPQPLRLDLVWLQDLALAPWAAVRLNEAYVSQYLDHQPLHHDPLGWVVATRQGAPVQGRVPWLLSGSLGHAVAFATDALQTAGLALRAGVTHGRLGQPLPSTRLQHEHAQVGLQERAFTLAPGDRAQLGFFGWLQHDHPEASSAADLALVDAVLALPEAGPWSPPDDDGGQPAGDDPRSLFAVAPPWPAEQPDRARLLAWYGDGWRHEDRSPDGQTLGFFQDGDAHVVTRAHELQVLRPHGHLLRSGSHWTPDEQAVASTVWMAGVFHSSLSQGHASANRLLSTQRGYLGQFRGLGLRVFVDDGAGWQLLALPSAMRMSPTEVRWMYQAGGRRFELVADAAAEAPEVGLRLQVIDGGPLAVLVSLHLAINSRDGSDGGVDDGPVHWRADDDRRGAAPAGQGGQRGDWWLQPAPGSDLASRFPGGGLRLHCSSDGRDLAVLGDEALFLDGRSRRQPYLCLRLEAVRALRLVLQGALLPAPDRGDAPPLGGGPQPPACLIRPAATTTGAGLGLLQLADWLPWLAHNALVHYLTPRGLEQFSGGGWGTRDVCQGPAELLLALGRFDALRDLLCRVFSAQNADGDWPQWFMFYPRDAHIRAGDSHGDIVFWPLAALADYLVASGDAALLDEPLPYHGAPGTEPLAGHVARALAVVRGRRIAGTALAAYGHGDWNDALQPADPAMREQLCSAWTVTLHHRMLTGLAAAWRACGRARQAPALDAEAQAVLADFQRLLLVDGVLTGYASFEQGQVAEWLLHPRDARTGIRYSALAMVHAILDGLFTPEQATAHAALIAAELTGPDGLRLFDRPLRYQGGTMRLFQRGESASYFGREIGLMYMHAHLRWAEALALLGRADDLLRALQLANPIGLQALLPQAAPRQRNCYYSSSDAAFADRAEASAHYDRIQRGEVALEGGWRIYSSGAGIAYRLVLQRLLGLTQQAARLGIDPVLSPSLDGLQVSLPLYGHAVDLRYRVGPLGHGPSAATLDGEPLALLPGTNPYRKPGVWLDAQLLRQRLAAGARRLEISVG